VLPGCRVAGRLPGQAVNWATKNNVKFGKPSEAGASSDVKVEPDKALVAYNPEQVSWGLVNGQWVGSQD
jgi:hypothetical protein